MRLCATPRKSLWLIVRDRGRRERRGCGWRRWGETGPAGGSGPSPPLEQVGNAEHQRGVGGENGKALGAGEEGQGEPPQVLHAVSVLPHRVA